MALISKLLGFVGLNKTVIVLASLLLGSSYLLINSYKANGKQSEAIKSLEQNNSALALAYNKRMAEYLELQEKQLVRDEQQREIDFDLTILRSNLKGIKNESCIDMDLGDDFASVFRETSDSD